MNTLQGVFSAGFTYFTAKVQCRYLNAIPKNTGRLHDIFITDVLLKGKITKNIFWNLNLDNIFNQIYQYYEYYAEPGFLMNLGLKINLL